jgi:hypothetical protein
MVVELLRVEIWVVLALLVFSVHQVLACIRCTDTVVSDSFAQAAQ